MKTLIPEELMESGKIICSNSSSPRETSFVNYLTENNYEAGIMVDDSPLKVDDINNIVHIQVPYIQGDFQTTKVISDTYLKMTTLPLEPQFCEIAQTRMS